MDELAAVERRLWIELQQAAAVADHDWRTLTLATADDDRAEARLVVLREVDPAARELVFYTDARSPKVAQLRARPLGTLLAWSARLAWQLRLAVALDIDTDGARAAARWSSLKDTGAARDYLGPLAPGSPLAGEASAGAASRGHFALVSARVQHIDWLELRADGHRRASFGAEGARWLQP
jgi:hypothetical protein